MKKFLVALAPLLFMACLFGSSRMMKPGAVVATVDGRIITVANFDSTVDQIQKNVDPLTPFDDLKQAALDSLIKQKLIQERTDSIKAYLNQDWEFSLKKNEDVTQTVFKVLFDKQITGRIHIDTAEVTKHYDENKDKYIDPEKVWARHILVRPGKPDTVGNADEKARLTLIAEEDQIAGRMAEAVLERARAGENWDSLAAKYSQDANNSGKGGDLGYFYKGRMAPEFDSVTFAAEKGSIVGPIKTKFGYHIIKIEDHAAPTPRPLDPTMSAEIFQEILSTRERQLSGVYVDSLKKAGIIHYNDSLFTTADSLVENRTWAMSVNATDTVYGITYKESLPKFLRWKKIDSLTVENKKEMLDMMLTTYLLRSAARTLGYLDLPEVKSAADEVVSIEANLRISRMLNDTEYNPTEDEVAAYFAAHEDDYKEKRPLQVQHLLFQDTLLEDSIDSTRAEAVRDSIIAGSDFNEMVRRYYPGEPDIRETLSNLDYIGPDEMGSDFYGVADTMQVGSISHPVRTAYGYHLIKLQNKKQDKTMAQVRPGIKQKLRDGRSAVKTAALVAEWRKGAIVQVNEDVVKNFQPEEKKVIRIEAKAPEQEGS
jgi:parvulin-like peptidyl-prolyl isomerase